MILQWRIAPGDRVLQVSTVNFDASIEEIFVPLTSGATLVIPGADTFSAMSRLLRFIAKERITILDFTTRLWHEVVHYLAEHAGHVPSSVRLCLVGGERATRATYNTWLKVGGDRIRWINTYGPTEATIVSTVFEVPAGQLGREMSSDPPIGRAIANTFVYVLDSERRLAPPGVAGELYIGGVGVARGYLNQPELTVERFTRDPFREVAALMYQTGDRVRHRADGELEYLGRIDTQVKLRGYRIELGEIEAQLATYPAIRDGAVALRPTPSGSNALIAYVVPAAEATVAPDDILTWLQERIPSFMVPSMCLVLKSFPQTPSGKVDRNMLPAPDWTRALTAAPASPIEGLLATVIELWQEILDISGLQPSDDFFALGGDSLRAMRLASKIELRLGHTVPIALLLQHRTAEKYALALQEAFAHEELSHLVLIRDGARRKPLFFIHPIFGDVWGYRNLTDALKYDQAIYGMQMRGLDGKLPPHQTIEECAADYISLIQSVQPHGPYVLAGYSSGGLVAYEMACQLVSLGEEVDFLGLIDTAIPPKLEVRLDWMNPQHVGRFVWNFAMAVASLRYYKPRDMLHFIALCLGRGLAKLWPRSRRRAAAVAAAWPGVNPQQYSYFVANFTAHHLEFIRTYLRAVESFVPRAYPGHVHLFRSERAPLFSPEGPLLGWERVPMGSIEATKVKGLHWNMLDAAYVGRLAECMSQALRACGERAVVSMVVYGILPEFSSLLFRLLPEA